MRAHQSSPSRQVCPVCGRETSMTASFCEWPDCGAYLFPPSDDVPKGDVEPLEAGRDADAPIAAPALRLEDTQLEVPPGEQCSTTLVISNLGSRVATYAASVSGSASQFAELAPARLVVYPGEQGRVAVTFSPRRSTDPHAGAHAFDVVVADAEAGRVASVRGTVVVGPHQRTAAELERQRSRGHFRRFTLPVTVSNGGNTAVQLSVKPADPDSDLTWSADDAVELDPAQQVVHPVKGRAPMRWFGRSRTYPFTINVIPQQREGGDGPASPTVLQGSRVQLPLLPAWLLAVLGVLAVVGGVLGVRTILASDEIQTVSVPSVVGDRRSDAAAALRDRGLEPRAVQRYDEEAPAGQVIGSDPASGSTLAVGEEVTLYVSRGPREASQATVPNVRGDPVDAARSTVEGRGLEVKVQERHHPEVAEGVVIRTDPAAGATLPLGDAVTLVVSKGPAPPDAEPLPDVAGMSEGDANAALVELELDVEVEYQTSDTVEEGVAIRSDPPAETDVLPGDFVTLVVSSGKPPLAAEDLFGHWFLYYEGPDVQSDHWWLRLDDDGTFLFHPDLGAEMTGTWEFTDSTVTLQQSDGGVMLAKVIEVDDTLQLEWNGDSYRQKP